MAPPTPPKDDSEVLVSTTFGPAEFQQRWADAVSACGLRVRQVDRSTPDDQVGDLSRVRFALCYDPPPGLLQKCSNLMAVQSMGAGVSPGMLEDRVCPTHLPLLRIVDPLTAQRMATFVFWSIVNWQRKCDAYLEAQRAHRWDMQVEEAMQLDNADVRVGIMGLGAIGRAVADLLLAGGYQVSAWTRTPKQKGGVACYAGRGQLRDFAEGTGVLVCLVPLTPETRGLLNAQLFGWLRRGALVINVSRGAHLEEQDLLAALDSGQLGGAVLDVFRQEPLPADSPLWSHPKVRLFPHVASTPHIGAVLDQVLENRRLMLEGRPVPRERVVCRQRGY